jgi:hypothetical protein
MVEKGGRRRRRRGEEEEAKVERRRCLHRRLRVPVSSITQPATSTSKVYQPLLCLSAFVPLCLLAFSRCNVNLCAAVLISHRAVGIVGHRAVVSYRF